MAPIQSVYAVQGRYFCLIKTPDNLWDTLEVECGGENANHVYFKSGIGEGTQLAMSPRDHLQLMNLPDIATESKIELPEHERKRMQSSEFRPDGGRG